MKECICKICDKQYSSIQSLCNHNKKFHNKINLSNLLNVTNIASIVTPILEKTLINVTKDEKDEHLVTSKFLCKYCEKKFKRRQNKWVHENKYCKKMKELANSANETQLELNDSVNTKSGDISNVINSNNTTTTTTNNTTNNGTINNITINNYKNDNLDYITDNYIKRMFTFLKNENDLHINLPKVIENIKFNPNHKENNNVKITNMRSKVGMKYDNNKWLTVDKDELLNELYKMTIDMLATWAKKDEFLTDEMKMYYARFNAISKCVLNTNIKENINRKAYKLKTKSKEEIHKKAYIYTKNNENILDV